MGDPTEYRIETVTDMLKVPRDKWFEDALAGVSQISIEVVESLGAGE